MSWITKAYSFDTVYNGYIIVSANVGGCLGCTLISTLPNHVSYKSKTLILASAEVVAMGMIWGAF